MRGNLWKIIVILIAVVGALWALVPTYEYNQLTEEDFIEWRKDPEKIKQLKELEGNTIKLGLDLQGGVHLVLETDVIVLFREIAHNKDARFNTAMIKVEDALAADFDADPVGLMQIAFESEKADLTRYFGERLKSTEEVLEFLRAQADDAVERSLTILRNRIDQFGVSEPTILKQGDNRIIVELPGVKDPEQAKGLSKSAGKLEFKLLREPDNASQILQDIDAFLAELEEDESESDTTTADVEPESGEAISGLEDILAQSAGDSTATDSAAAALADQRPLGQYVQFVPYQTGGGNFYVPEDKIPAIKTLLYRNFGDGYPALRRDLEEKVGDDFEILFSNKPSVENETGTYFALYVVKKEPELAGEVITEARQEIYGGIDPALAGQPIVTLKMNDAGKKDWGRVTSANIGKRISIVLDGKIHSAPTIQDKITGGNTQITGMASLEEATALAIVLRAGALPAPVKVIEERTVGATLGQDSIDAGEFAGLLGLALVLVFMLIYYHMAGAVADIALLLNVVFVMAILTYFKFTLTLPGIAGIILTVGMAVDANVLIFDRIREEIRNNKTVRAAIEEGYGRAFITILDANVTTFFMGVVLFEFGTGPIKGFALTLMIGIVSSMFTAIFVTRVIINMIYDKSTIEQRISIGMSYEPRKRLAKA